MCPIQSKIAQGKTAAASISKSCGTISEIRDAEVAPADRAEATQAADAKPLMPAIASPEATNLRSRSRPQIKKNRSLKTISSEDSAFHHIIKCIILYRRLEPRALKVGAIELAQQLAQQLAQHRISRLSYNCTTRIKIEQ